MRQEKTKNKNAPVEIDFDTGIAKFTDRQLEVCAALDEDYKYILYGGALGGGKSYLLRWLAVRILMSVFANYGIKGGAVMLACEDYPTLKDRQIAKIEKEFPAWLGKYHDNHKIYGKCYILGKRYGGGVICLRNLDDPSKYQCFHPDTEILTLNGWTPVFAIRAGELTATINPATRQMTYKPASKVWDYDFDGDMETMCSRGAPAFSVTPNHTIWASTKRCSTIKPYRADQLPATAKIPQTVKWEGTDRTDNFVFISPGANGKSVRFSPGDWMEFLGWYLAEGSLDPAPRYTIRISQVNGMGRERIIKLLKRNKINYHVQEKEINFNNRALNKYLSVFGKSHDKYVPREIMTYSQSLLMRFLWAVVEADGTWINDKVGHFVTSSKRLSDDISEIAIKCGYRPTVSLRHDKHGSNPYGDGHRPRYHVHLLMKNTDTTCGQHRKKERYQGKVYCLTVPPHHVVLTRRKGRVSWSGQSAEFVSIMVDELTKNDINVFTDLRMRLRWPGVPDEKCVFVGATNPGGVGHNYVKAYWVTKVYPPEFISPIDFRPRFKFIPSKAEDNPHLDQSYWETLHSLPEHLRAAFRDGSWDVFEGQAFSFMRHTHVIPEQPIPAYAPIYTTFDWGFGAPFSWGWWWADGDGRIYRFAEFYGWNGTPNKGLRWEDSRIADEIVRREVELSQKYGIDFSRAIRKAGPDCFQKKPDYKGGGQGPSTAEIFALKGIYLSPGDATRSVKIRQFRERLKAPADGSMPMLIVYDCCEQFIRTIPDITVHPSDPEDIDDKGEDHIYDEACHVCMARPLSLKIPPRLKTEAQAHIDMITKPTPRDPMEIEDAHAAILDHIRTWEQEDELIYTRGGTYSDVDGR